MVSQFDPRANSPSERMGCIFKGYIIINGLLLVLAMFMFAAVEAALREILRTAAPGILTIGMAVMGILMALYAGAFISLVAMWNGSLAGAYGWFAYHAIIVLGSLIAGGFGEAIYPIISTGIFVLLFQSNQEAFAPAPPPPPDDPNAPPRPPAPDRGGAFDLIFGRNRWREKREKDKAAGAASTKFVQASEDREFDAARSMADTARSMALGGDFNKAFSLLDSAIVQGYNDVELMRTDRAFAKLREANPDLFGRLLDKAARQRK